MNSKTVLIIEDEPGIADSVIYAFQLEGFNTRWETQGLAGVEATKQDNIDLIVLDIGLPDISGMEVCKLLRQSSNIPIIFLTARSDEIDRIVGLELGGDDYMIKPFSPRELTARAKAIFRRIGLAETKTNLVGITINEETRAVSYKKCPLLLTKYEYEILLMLTKAAGRVYSREQLMEAIWSEPTESFDRAVDTHIKTLRAKFKKISPETDPITTHRGVGYSLKIDKDDS